MAKNKRNQNILNKYSYIWITLAFFLFSLLGHWIFAWETFVQEQIAHNQEIEFSEFTNQTLRDTFENWQSEFLQLAWQVGGLAFFLFIGSPQSKDGDDRLEAKVDHIIAHVSKKSEDFIKEIEKEYPKS